MSGILGKGLLAILVAFKLTGGGGGGAGSHAQFYSPTPGELAEGVVQLNLAILPFENLAEDPTADRKITGALVTYLLSTGVCEVADPGAVDTALFESGARGTPDPKQARELAQKLGVHALLMGSITEHGLSRTAMEPTPIVALDARLVDVATGRIVWAASISETGASNKLFGAGGAKPLASVSHTAVAKMVANIFEHREQIIERLGVEAQPAVVKSPGGQGSEAGGAATPASAGLPADSVVLREGPWSPGVLETLIPELEGVQRADPEHSRHAHAMARTVYLKDGAQIELEIIDYQTAVVAEKLVALLSADGTREDFLGLPSYTWTSQFGYYHRSVIAGRVGLLARTAEGSKRALDALLTELLAQMGE